MGVVSGAIGITDNVTAVLRSIKNEQSSFRADVEKTRTTLEQTWAKKYEARIESAAATQAISNLTDKMKPLRDKVVTAVAVKDMAMSKVKSIASKIKEVGSTVAKPVVSVVVKGMQALNAVGQGIAKVAKVAAAGVAIVGAGLTAGLRKLYDGAEDAARAQIEAETKLEAVLGNVASIQAQGAGAAAEAAAELGNVASALQQVGVIGDEVTLAGMQQLATYQLGTTEISKLSAGMTDLLAQQYGLNATQENAVSVANMIGKAMEGQTSALSRAGILEAIVVAARING